MAILQLRSQLHLHTRCENQVKNEINREPIRYGDQRAIGDYQKQYPKALHRPVGPSRIYNCHGLSFASRRTWIWSSTEIAMVLVDDEYIKVDRKEVLPGDVVVYSTRGDAEHSGLVVSVDNLGPRILSKWGACHEVVHRLNECPYDSTEIVFYRIKT
jgi:hypothetical protein